MNDKLLLSLFLFVFLISIVSAQTDFVSILNKQNDWLETPYPYTDSAKLAEIDKMDLNGDSGITCEEACSSKGYKGCVYSMNAYYKKDDKIYLRRETNPRGVVIDLEHATRGEDGFDKVSMYYKCTNDEQLLEDLDNIKIIPVSSQLGNEAGEGPRFSTAAEFDFNGDNRISGEESCEFFNYGNCIFTQKFVENIEIENDFFTRKLNFEIDKCSSSMDIAELDNSPSDYRNINGMDVYCLKENPTGFAGLMSRIFGWFKNLFS